MNKLDDLRNKIDQIDEQMLELFLKRLDLAKEIGTYKRQNNLPILDEKREKEILDKARLKIAVGNHYALYEKFIKNLIAIAKEVQK